MDESKPKENTYSRDRLETASIQAPAETTKAPEPSETTTPPPPTPEPDIRVQIADLAGKVGSNWPRSLAECPAVLKRTRHIWLTLAVGVAALMALSILTQQGAEWFKERRELRQEKAIATVTPEHLIARCGRAAQDETKEV